MARSGRADLRWDANPVVFPGGWSNDWINVTDWAIGFQP
jgi:hypothetical protein